MGIARHQINMARISTKTGDVFSVKLGDGRKKYFQYIASDLTQLNSDVIRVFSKFYPIETSHNLQEVIDDEVEFHAHCVTKFGIKLCLWEKVGNFSKIGSIEHVLFRDSSDYGNPAVSISQKWWVWKINQERQFVGKLTGANKSAEIGVVVRPSDIISRIVTGKYDFVYPNYE